MDIGISQIVNIVVASSTSYLAVFSPVFLLIGGLVLAMVVANMILSFFGKGGGGDAADFGFDDDDAVDNGY